MLVPQSSLLEEVRQLGDIRRDPSRLVLCEQLRSRSAPRLVLIIDVSELLTVVIAHHETGFLLLIVTALL